MTLFLKVAVCILLTLILCIVLTKHGADFSLLLSITVCCIGATVAIHFLEPVISFINQLESLGHLDRDMISILLKAVAISLISEFVSLICVDAGNASLGKILKILASTVILWLSIPLFNSLLDLADNVLVNT